MREYRIKGKIYEAEEKEFELDKVRFWEENPRLYEILNVSGQPTQAEIQDKLSSMEHVKKLRIAIEANGLLEPILVRDGDFIVLEGNSRLSAYKMLYEKNPLKWNTIRCNILPSNMPKDAILTLLGQYHLIGRTDWDNFAQAGFLYRLMKESGKEIDTIAIEQGMKVPEAKKLVKIYTFMHEHNDIRPDAWSYYDVLLSNQGIQRYRNTNDKVDEVIIGQIKSGKIYKARDLQDKLGVIAKGKDKDSTKIMNRIISEEISIDEGFDLYQDLGKNNNAYQAVQKFRTRIDDKDFQHNLKCSDAKSVAFELGKIKKTVEKLLGEFEELKKRGTK